MSVQRSASLEVRSGPALREYPAETISCDQVVASIDDPGAGPSHSVLALTRAIARTGASASIHAVDRWRGAATHRVEEAFPIHRHPLDRLPIASMVCASNSLREALDARAGAADIIHTHGLWLFPNVYPSWVVRRADARAKVVLSPRGMLAPQARQFSRFRKRLYWEVFQKRALSDAACLHATSEEECEDIRKAGLSNPVAVIPNGVDLPSVRAQNAKRLERTVLSLGRIHPKKGLERLVRAWAEVEPNFPDWNLLIAGPAERGHDCELRHIAHLLKLKRVQVVGPAYGEARAAAYEAADLFVLPTLSENFAMTVAEALAAGVPVISTKGAPWRPMEVERCGWWIDHGVAPMAAALRCAMSAPRQELEAMGQRGASWMARDFSWDSVAGRMLDVYRWLSGGRDRPTCVNV